ncbi:MAG: triose-phosphate isomerase [Chlamydiales bacterium]|nr:triose-phosphate isomerase [Chlamydiales bacterium]
MGKKSRLIIVGNWKMYKTAREAEVYVAALIPQISSSARVLLAVPFTALHAASAASRKSSIQVGAQNMHDAPEGAFTGEISAGMLKEAGAQFVLLGHSERRSYFQETSAFINRKVKRALAEGLTPIVCVGESEKEREAGKTEEILLSQLSESLTGLTVQELEKIHIAYEPVWAIGTGKTATPEIADAAHLICRNFLKEKCGALVAEKIAILYGGSVKPESANALLSMPNIDGALVGGAALDPSVFAQIINSGQTV